MQKLARLDHEFVWHPFTQMRDWLRGEPTLIVRGHGATLIDAHGREYLDANSSIWTNLHGHRHPQINAAIRRQLGKISHSSALGLANEPASLLAEKLVRAANPPRLPRQPALAKVFFSDDGSTAMEVALKLAYEFARRSGRSSRPRFLSLAGAYHGDTVGAVSLGHIALFHRAYGGLLFKSEKVMSPYCYRCPFNRAKPERADARDYRRCNWECVGKVEQKFARAAKTKTPITALVVEPLMQGAAGMIPQPRSWLRRVAEITRGHGAQIIADEVMTGFGRTSVDNASPDGLFACHHEGVQPDFLALAKGLTGGYLPMAATLTTQAVFDAFLGDYSEFKTFFHGHSFTGNQLGAAAALANMQILTTPASICARRALEKTLRQELESLWTLENVGDIRQVGLIAGIELVKNWRTRAPFELRERVGIRVCDAMARRGVLTRPIGNVIVLMPPYCTTTRQIKQMVDALREAVCEVLENK
ncbi:MAG: adenosylmethionine--8-amino-7-oxononanoate transaminase [Verrucomicrobia bacterium]|nr:adenosylmethionine--8-amino-7-oxononanoate transaminase [Verrucomicrobiota bacterium]